ncbi:DUF1254 domain-containing protein [Pleurocapsa sp. PCC 7319]|uniref:DUF1254 domain-containing protein n=1 Tax=Pleurocapsa sp. PCC 7319 TaxID=118161 RepID=UPI00034A1486|nr:DUF1254 domain-containing protein [Pleurocapsa sp. PCC 7319]
MQNRAEKVTPETYIRAETDFAFARFQENAGDKINQFYYITEPTPLDQQDVIRMNRDTLYAGAVVDIKGGATVTIPEFPDDRYFSVYVIDNDHYAAAVFYEPGTHKIPDDTRYVGLVQRIRLMDPSDEEDIALVNRLQKSITIQASSSELFPEPKWDKESMLTLRAEYEKEFQKFDQYDPDWMGARGEVDEKTRHLAAAGAWGLFPEEDAVYINYTGSANPNQCYKATYQVPENDAFWSISVYGKDGFIKSDNNTINDQNVVFNDDGTFTAYFGSKECCGEQANRVDITEGWNFLMRVYRPGKTVLSQEYKLPEVEVVNTEVSGTLTTVTKENFIVAETDKYFSDHVKNHPVNTIRHSRKMSSKDNQFVIRENQDVLYSHAVVDISEGATLVNPAWDVYSVIQVIDEHHYTIAVVYPGDEVTISSDMVELGDHVFLNIRTGVRSLDEAGMKEAHEHQDNIRIFAKSAKPYISKGFDRESLDKIRAELEARKEEIIKPWPMFGTKNEVDPEKFLIASAAGWGGLPAEHASYSVTIQPSPDLSSSGEAASLTLPVPPLNFEQGGFFSVTAYDKDGWIATEPFALNNRQAKPNEDGSYTFRFNSPNAENNINIVPGWNMLIRLYMPNSLNEILAYINEIDRSVKVEKLNP